MKRLVRIGLVVLTTILWSNCNWGQTPYSQMTPWPTCDSSFYYFSRGAVGAPHDSITKVTDVLGLATTQNVCHIKKRYTGAVNGLACNSKDGLLYYKNVFPGNGSILIAMDANCDTVVLDTLPYDVNGGMDICGRYLRYKQDAIMRYDMTTGIEDTIPVTPALGFITDIDYNPFDCNYYLTRFMGGRVFVVDQGGVCIDTIITGIGGQGGIGVGTEGENVFIAKFGNFFGFDIATELPSQNTPINPQDIGAPQADASSFKCDNVVATVGNPMDTIDMKTCEDSVQLSFTSISTGDINHLEWDFGDGTTSQQANPTHKFDSPGTYQVILTASRFTCSSCLFTDANQDTITVILSNDTLNVFWSAVNPTCFNSIDGTITVDSIQSGTGPFNYQWSSGGSTSNETNLPDGIVTLNITDQTGCAHSEDITLTAPPLVTVSPVADTTICVDGTATLSAAAGGGNGAPYTITWAGVGTGNQTVTPGATTCYDVVATDPLGCVSNTHQVCVNLMDSISVLPSGLDVCPGGITDLTALGSGGSGALNYQWTEGANVLANTQNTQHVPTNSLTTYCVTVSDGCETPDRTECIDVQVYSVPNIVFDAIDRQGCSPLTVTFSNLTDPTNLASCLWDFGDGSASANCDEVHTYDQAGDFDVTLTITTIDGCVADSTAFAYINVGVSPVAGFSFNPVEMDWYDTEVDFVDESSGAATWSWNFAGQGSSTEQNPVFVFPDNASGTYDVTQVVTNQYGCQDSITHAVYINAVTTLYVPNAFTPDGDGINDIFMAQGDGVDPANFEMQVFDRWGQLVFSSQSMTQGWDGSIRGVQVPKTDVFVWKIAARGFEDGTLRTYEGHVTLLR